MHHSRRHIQQWEHLDVVCTTLLSLQGVLTIARGFLIQFPQLHSWTLFSCISIKNLTGVPTHLCSIQNLLSTHSCQWSCLPLCLWPCFRKLASTLYSGVFKISILLPNILFVYYHLKKNATKRTHVPFSASLQSQSLPFPVAHLDSLQKKKKTESKIKY